MRKLLKSLTLRAEKVGAILPSADGSPAPKIEKDKTGKKRPATKEKPSSTVIQINGNVTGSNIVIGNDNTVENTSND